MKQKYNFKEIFADVFGKMGFSTKKLSITDLNEIRSIVKSHYLSQLDNYNISFDDWKSLEMNDYNKFSHLIPHDQIWNKKNRILPLNMYNRIIETSFFKQLKNELGDIFISDEDEVGRPEIYWRLVRPLPNIDVGPIHADAWFWELGHGSSPITHKRIKFWFSIYNEPGQNGFCYVPSSHLKDYKYKSEERHGIKKPVFNSDDYNLDINVFESSPGDFIVFNDRLLHGGKPGGSKSRVSIEFTLFVEKKYLDNINAINNN